MVGYIPQYTDRDSALVSGDDPTEEWWQNVAREVDRIRHKQRQRARLAEVRQSDAA